ncbi:hypothetical protein KY338_07170 [Candidatus Woesearchaeota archaeon]|nr:hypothetical protein [Candidatus Woesearchaeota archaeon]
MSESKIKEQEKNVENIIRESWNEALVSWNHPSIPRVITAKEEVDFEVLGEIGLVLKQQLAFMKYPEFQTYANLKNIREKFSDFEKGTKVIFKHEPGHRYCPYDGITSLILARKAEKKLKQKKIKYDARTASKDVLNLFTDTCINTHLIRTNNPDIAWAYQEMSKNNNNTALWRVYAGSLEQIWNAQILPKEMTLSKEEKQASENIAKIFNRNVLEMQWWEQGIENYTELIAPFLEQKSARQSIMSATASKNIPKEISPEEIARRLAKNNSSGLPTNKEAVKEFRELMAGYGHKDPIKASIAFYENLAKKYDVSFASQPFGRPRSSPFSINTWSSSDPVDELDVQQSIQSSGILIPGITTVKWNSRTTNQHQGVYEIIPALDIYLDSSGSMVNPTEVVSLATLACFVVAKKARKAGIRAINYDDGIIASCERTHDLYKAYEVFVKYGRGGTTFPVKEFLENPEEDPRLDIIVTDTYFNNITETCEAIRIKKKRNKNNMITIYAISPNADANELVSAGAECIQGTTTKIFRHMLAKAEKTYTRK